MEVPKQSLAYEVDKDKGKKEKAFAIFYGLFMKSR
jgi:hypothetical protein